MTRNTRKTQQNTRQHPCSTAYQIEHGSSRGNIPDIYQNNSFLHISVVIIDPLSSDNSFLILVILYHTKGYDLSPKLLCSLVSWSASMLHLWHDRPWKIRVIIWNVHAEQLDCRHTTWSRFCSVLIGSKGKTKSLRCFQTPFHLTWIQTTHAVH